MVTRGEWGWGRRIKMVKGVQFIVMEVDLTSDGEHTIEYTEVIL